MIKVFLSHSTLQKPLVESVANEIGWDFAILDKFVFESGRKVIDEINNALDVTSIFVLFASKESLNSDWCKTELANIRDLVDEGKCFFCAFSVDENIDVTQDAKPWVRQYLTNYYDNPKTLARVIQRKIIEILWEEHPEIKIKEHFFVGRDKELSQMMSMVYENRSLKNKCVIASGIRHIGRKRFLLQFMVYKMNNGLHPSYFPFEVSLKDTDSLDSFIKQLNDYINSYSKSELDSLLIDVSKHKEIAIKLINDIVESHELIRIDDDNCIINKNGYIEDWFLDVIHQPDLSPKVCIFVASTCSLNAKTAREEKQVCHLQLQPMKRSDMKILFNQYAEAKGVKCDNNTTEDLLANLTGYPDQVFEIVDLLNQYGMPTVLKELPAINKMYESDMSNLLDEIKKDAQAYQLLILMAKFEYIGYHQLYSIFQESKLVDILDKFEHYAIYECFGATRNYLRLNRVLADYIDRNRLVLDKVYQQRLDNYTKELLEQTDEETLNLAEDLYRSKKMLSDPRFKVSTEAILPSVALKVIVDQYRNNDFNSVVDLAKRILYDNNRHDYGSVQRSIRYWLCLAYCKLGQDYLLEIEKEIKYFTGYTKFFILGYYERLQGHYPQAQHYYELALESSKNYMQKNTSKASHELVITKMKQNDYNGALELAKQNYETEKSNVYHIEAYFRCYVKSDSPDKNLLKDLIKNMRSSYDANKDIIADTFEAEYLFYIDKEPIQAINKLKEVLRFKKGQCLNYTAETLRNFCKMQKMLPIYRDAIKNNNNFVEDNNYVFE
jgi:hypothetical protein